MAHTDVDFQSVTQANSEKKIRVLPIGVEPDDLPITCITV